MLQERNVPAHEGERLAVPLLLVNSDFEPKNRA